MAITPKPGFMIDPNNPNSVIPIPTGTVATPPVGGAQPGAQVGNQGKPGYDVFGNPVAQPTWIDTQGANVPNQGKPGYDVFGNPIGSTQQTSQVSPATSQADASYVATPQNVQTKPADTYSGGIPNTMLPTAALGPGSQGQDVQALQSYLVQQGYLTPEQVAGGSGTYGPQTTAAVAKLQQDLGIQAGTNAGYYGPQTQSALAQKYQGIFQAKQGTPPPSTGGAASAAIAGMSQQSSDPVFGAMASTLAPIMNSLTQVLSNINNPALTAVSLQQEYNDLAQQNNLPELQAQMLNMQNIMNGTPDDIRNEVSKAGGFVTESQVQAMTSARNNVILKQYNALSTQYQAAQTNVQNMMQYATTDQATQLQRQQVTASITESMASIESQMMNMGITMQNHAADNLNKIVTNIGYTGLAAQAEGNPQMLSYYENLLNLAPGTLSNPTALSQMETYRQSQLSLGQQKVQISLQNSGSLMDYRQVMEQSRYSTIASNTIRQMYQSNKNPVQIYNSSAPILSRIDAALPMALDPKNKDKTAPDLDLVDAYVQIARGGQNITEAQVDTLLGGLGIGAKWDVATQKITGTGILNDGTRKSLASLAKGIVSNQQKQANTAVQQINDRLSAISGFPSDMLMQSPADIQLYTDPSAGSTYTGDTGTSYVLPY